MLKAKKEKEAKQAENDHLRRDLQDPELIQDKLLAFPQDPELPQDKLLSLPLPKLPQDKLLPLPLSMHMMLQLHLQAGIEK
nr:hypothetical protein [Tanacetum cinerariifolium]